jgi:hypothetical protein
LNSLFPLAIATADGNLHRHGVMRMATASDEILPLKDHRVQANPSYLAIIVLSRVEVKLGTLDIVNTKVIEDLFRRLQSPATVVQPDQSR